MLFSSPLSDIIGTIVTNANGYGFKLPNGLIVNVMTNIGQAGNPTQTGSFYYYDDATTYTFPIPYVNEYPSCFGMNNVDAWGVVTAILRTKTAITRITFVRPNNDRIYIGLGDAKFIAIGK